MHPLTLPTILGLLDTLPSMPAAKKALKTKERNAAEEQAPDGEHDVRPEPSMPAIA